MLAAARMIDRTGSARLLMHWAPGCWVRSAIVSIRPTLTLLRQTHLSPVHLLPCCSVSPRYICIQLIRVLNDRFLLYWVCVTICVTDRTARCMKVWALSDVHTDYRENLQRCRATSCYMLSCLYWLDPTYKLHTDPSRCQGLDNDFSSDAVILAGDVSDDVDTFVATLHCFKTHWQVNHIVHAHQSL